MSLILAVGVLNLVFRGATGVKSVRKVLVFLYSLLGEIWAPMLSMIGIRVTLWPVRKAAEFLFCIIGSSFFFVDAEISSEALFGLGLILSLYLRFAPTMCGAK